MNHVTTALGRALRARRVFAGLRQTDLAREAGVSRETVARIERGATTPLRATVEVIARALGVTAAELVQGDGLPGSGREAP